MLMVTNGIVIIIIIIIIIILNSFLLPITEEVRVCTGQRIISACVMYYSEFDQEVNAFI